MSKNEKKVEISCAYCDPDEPAKFLLGEGSEEHVILSALGGLKTTRNICCVTCNNRLGDEIDKELAKNLAPLCNLFSIKNGRKGTSPTLSTHETMDGQSLKISPGARFQLKKSSIEEITIDPGKTVLKIKANTVSEAENLLKNYLKKFGYGVKTETSYTTKSTPPPIFSFTLTFDVNEKRSAAKMLLNFLATSINPERIRSKDFRKFVTYINGESEISNRIEPWLNMDIPDIKLQYKFGHTVLFAASAEKQIVVGVLVLFGCIKITALMSTSWTGPTIGKMYCIDPCTGVHETIHVDAEKYVNTYPLHESPSHLVLKADMEAMIVEVQRRHREQRIEELLDEVRNNLPPSPSPEQLNATINEAVDRFKSEIQRISYEKPLKK